MAGIYIHIPFCKKACHYCNFHFSTNQDLQQQFVDALLIEMQLQNQFLTQKVTSVYFGGGTPSILPEAFLRRIFTALHTHFTIDSSAEVTLEANPDDITIEKLSDWKSLGINRLSIGIQSFYQEDLAWMNRAHDAAQALACIPLAQAAGFINLNIDLIYGTPTLSEDHWQSNVLRAMDMGIPHMSCYALTVEPKTALEKMIKLKKVLSIENEKQAGQFEMLMTWMRQNNYEHYEISNFAKDGMRSRHNSSYWLGEPYLGLGPSAHSYNGIQRQWNISNNALYVKSLQLNKLNCEVEQLTKKQMVNEYIMTSLRTIEGLNLEKVANEAGESSYNILIKEANLFIKIGHLVYNENYLKTTDAGKLFVDRIAAALFQI